ncbi:hypothetical protein FQN57_002531 [Myotisia sp. PD_48]|nr:hypothetical protein FQN57_002531 [Myotisia sp. PD_48]
MEEAGPKLRVAVEGCGHGKLHEIYASVTKSAEKLGWDGVDLVIIGGDFQAVRNSNDLSCMAVPIKYRQIGDFHEYYSGTRVAPYLTIFIGGNHEASNHLFELHYGGWVAPNIYYLGAANVIRYGPFRIAGMSGIWKGYDYRKPHFERLPYDDQALRTIYHVREVDVRKLLLIRSQVDIGISHDWPQAIEWAGDYQKLFRQKRHFVEDANSGRLGSVAARHVLERLRPANWFSGHMHCKFTASVTHREYVPPRHPTYSNQSLPSMPYRSETVMNAGPAIGGTGITHNAEEPVSINNNAKADGEKISAWQDFHNVAAVTEREEQDIFMREAEKYHQGVAAGTIKPGSGVTYEMTWKKVATTNDGLGREIQEVTASVAPGVSQAASSDVPHQVKNDDEINLDMDDLAPAENNQVETSSGADPTTMVKNADEINIDLEDEGKDTSGRSELVHEKMPRAREDENGTVSDDVRSQLPASFSKTTKKPKTQPMVDTTLPADITNKTTEFLALDKCENGREFLQLLELSPISEQDESDAQRPYQLKYDKEWLAITRALADGFVFGNQYTSVPLHPGDNAYQPDINDATAWVEENIVKSGKLTVPENFVVTAPVYDPSVSITTNEQPPEYPNPQTEAFCGLLGIENRLAMTESQQRAQNEALYRVNETARQFAESGREYPGTGHRGGGGGRYRGRGGSGRRRGRGGRGY